MRTFTFICAGLVLGVLLVSGSRALGMKAAPAYALFLTVWTAVAAWNLYQGVATAGYTVLEELPIFLIIVLVPAMLVPLALRRAGGDG